MSMTTPIVDFVQNYAKSGTSRLHMPGHKGQALLGFEGLELAQLPDSLHQNLLTTFLGFPGPDFASTDYFSLLPWFFLFSAGHFLRRLLQPVMEKSRQPKTDGPLYSLSKPLVWLGQHSLLLYILIHTLS